MEERWHANGTELWASDGTAAGTYEVADLTPGVGHSDLMGLCNWNSILYFVKYKPYVLGGELWKTDGTSGGTVNVKQFTGVRPVGLTPHGVSLFFAAGDDRGLELWKTDGTPDGTVRVQDIRPGRDGSSPGGSNAEFASAEGSLFFAADDGVHGEELWVLPPESSGEWTDVSAGPLGDPVESPGASWGDYDFDGLPDLYVSELGSQSTSRLLHNDGNSAFSDATSGALASIGRSQLSLWGDYDNDGRPDLFVGGFDSNHLFRNAGDAPHLRSSRPSLQRWMRSRAHASSPAVSSGGGGATA